MKEWEARREFLPPRGTADRRFEFERDRARLIHSAAFRRLQAKTQVLGISEGDFHRSRLTHSMEVAQISRGLVQTLEHKYASDNGIRTALPPQELAEAIAFAHDLGHPPFGHGGEIALNFMMRDHGGFEGNGQSLRILAKLESAHEKFGLNLTRRTMLGILKYPVAYEKLVRMVRPAAPDRLRQLLTKDWKPPKCFLATEQGVVDWILDPLSTADREAFTRVAEHPNKTTNGKSGQKSFDCSLMELADDIAYGVHDCEDAIALGLLTRLHWNTARRAFDAEWARSAGLGTWKELTNRLFKTAAARSSRKQAIGALVNAFITSAVVTTSEEFEAPLLKHKVDLPTQAKTFLDALKKLIRIHIIESQEVQTLEHRGRVMVMELFEAIASDPERLLPKESSRRLPRNQTKRHRLICDYLAGMTDTFATRMYERLFVPRHGTIFERL